MFIDQFFFFFFFFWGGDEMFLSENFFLLKIALIGSFLLASLSFLLASFLPILLLIEPKK